MSDQRDQYRAPTPWMGILVGFAITVIVLGIFALFVATAKTDRDVIGLSYGGGPFEGRQFQRTLEPGTGLTFVGWFDPVYKYPVTQRSYIISKAEGEGDIVGVVRTPSSNSILVDFEVATYFRLNTDKIQKFHEKLGLKYQAWTHEGWLTLLQESFKQQIEFALAKESRKWTDKELFSDENTLLTINTNIGRSLKENVSEILGDEYFCGVEFEPGQPCSDFTFVIKSINLPAEVVAEYENNRESAIAVETKKNEVLQRQEEAKAIEALNKALEASGPSYVLLKAIESGHINFWVIPSDQGLTLTTPGVASGGGSSATTTTTLP